MEFTYKDYALLIEKIRAAGYKFADYENYDEFDKSLILRHDVDYNIQKTIKMAEIESQKNISATYFVLLTSDFYNLFSKESESILKKLLKLGHKIGLHFDEKRYNISFDSWEEQITDLIKNELHLLSDLIGIDVMAVSMHRPSQQTLNSNLIIGKGIINSYDKEFFKNIKYISDSRMKWKENIIRILESGKYKKIQLLTHPFWYHDEPLEMKKIIEDFIYCREEIAAHRYKVFENNITQLSDILK